MSLNTNQKLYFSHVFLFHLFSVFTDLGWIYVLSQGVSIYYILIALMCYRFLQHALTVPVSYMLLKRFPIKTLFVFAIVIQAVYFIVLYSSVNFMLLLIPATLLFSLYDSLYYILRLDIERNIPCEKDIAKNTGYSTALATLAETIGIILLTYGLVFHPDTALAISLIGLFLSCIPILFLQIDHVRPPEKDEKFFSTMLLGKPIRAFLANPFVIVLLTTGLINELIFAIIPALLITFDIQLLHIGLLFGAMKILSFVASVVIGHFEDVDNRILYWVFGAWTIILFLTFGFLRTQNLPLLIVMYSFIGVSWEVCIKARSQRFVHQHLPASTGGTFLIWIENHSRVLMYVLLFFFLTFTELDHLHNFLLVSAAVIVGANLVMSWRVEKL